MAGGGCGQGHLGAEFWDLLWFKSPLPNVGPKLELRRMGGGGNWPTVGIYLLRLLLLYELLPNGLSWALGECAKLQVCQDEGLRWASQACVPRVPFDGGALRRWPGRNRLNHYCLPSSARLGGCRGWSLSGSIL